MLFRVFETGDGEWRGIARVPGGDLHLRRELAAHDATVHFAAELDAKRLPVLDTRVGECRCGGIMTGRETPTDCPLYGKECRPETPVGACMVSTEGICRIWHEHGIDAGLREGAR